MSVMGLDEVQQVNVLSMVAAVLHLGNITFTERGNYAGVQNDDCKNPLCICHNYESLNSANQISRKVGMFDRKLEGSHFIFDIIFY